VTSAKIIKGLGAGLDEAALNAVKETKFKPGKQRGKAVKVQVSIPIVFKLQ
jgi:periplasmic protein TonB